MLPANEGQREVKGAPAGTALGERTLDPFKMVDCCIFPETSGWNIYFCEASVKICRSLASVSP